MICLIWGSCRHHRKGCCSTKEQKSVSHSVMSTIRWKCPDEKIVAGTLHPFNLG